MKTASFFSAVVAGFFFVSCSQSSQMNQEELKAGIGESNAKWMAALEQGNAAGVAECYTEDSQFMPPNAPTMKGREGVKTFMEGMMKAGVKKIKLTTSEIEGDDKRALETGEYQVLVDGGKVVDQGKYLVEWKNQNGKWYFHRDMFNSNMPSPRIAAQKDQEVWVAAYKVKADKRKVFENFVRTRLYPSIDRSKPEMDMVAKQTRLVIPTEPEEDGSYRYMFIMDPVVKGGDYSIENLIISRHGKEEGQKILDNEFGATLVNPDAYEIIIGKQSEI